MKKKDEKKVKKKGERNLCAFSSVNICKYKENCIVNIWRNYKLIN